MKRISSAFLRAQTTPNPSPSTITTRHHAQEIMKPEINEMLAPLVPWGDGLFGASLQGGEIHSEDDLDGEFEELRAELTGDEWSVTYAPDEVQHWEVYRGQIPSREFWLSILRNSSCGGFRNL